MMVLRFMCANEAIKLLRGQRLTNETIHRDNGNNSGSVGFCFHIALSEHPETAIYEASKLLSGITDMDVCLSGWPKLPEAFTKSKARYQTGMIEELSSLHYSLDDFETWAMYTPSKDRGEAWYLPALISSVHWKEPILAAAK